MSNEYTNTSEPSELTEALLAQIREDVESDGHDESNIVDEVLPSPSRVELGAEASQIVDELLLETHDVSDELRTRVLAGVDQLMAERRQRKGLLEPLLKGTRRRNGLTLDDMSRIVGLPSEVIRGLEDGVVELRSQEPVDIAFWIFTLEQDNTDATAALARSAGTRALRETELAMAGDDDALHPADEFVAQVLDELAQFVGGKQR